MRVQYDEMIQEFERVLVKYGLPVEKARVSAKLFTEASLDGVYTHGLNRFPKFIASVRNGSVDIVADPFLEGRFGNLERWNGNKGPGNLNALTAMKRAISLAKENVFGCVTMSNTNHWMRPGAYGLLAAKKNCIGILWTNTVPNMPPWGAKDAHLGNNPLVVAIPHGKVPVLLDVAMSMFSYGKLEMYKNAGKELPIPGGFDAEGNMTSDPAKILETHQVFPIGYWKGSGLSLVLDLICATLGGGRTCHEVGKLPTETELSQIFIAINLEAFPDKKAIEEKIDASLQDLKQAIPQNPDQRVRFPGEGMVKTREENTRLGIPVDELVWKGVKEL